MVNLLVLTFENKKNRGSWQTNNERAPRAPPPLPRHELAPRHMHHEIVGTIGAQTWRPLVAQEEGSFKRSPPAPEASDTAGVASCSGGGGFIHPAPEASDTAGDSDSHTGERGKNSEMSHRQ